MSVTNDYMNKIIRNSSNDEIIWRYKNGRPIPIKVSYGYHFGDLGKGRDTYYWNMASSYRSTGHFGTGTYFLGKPESVGYSREERPLHKIDFNDYELLKVKSDTDAYILHNGLKSINYIGNFDSDVFEDMRTMLIERYNLKSIDISNAFYNVRNIYYSDKYQKASYDAKLDSLSTLFMKELGFNGIDVRGLSQYDNTSYGSVIYDLSKKKSNRS